MNDSYWLNATNLALGVVVAICAVVVALAVTRELAERMCRRVRLSAELDRDMRELVAEFDDHSFNHPELGTTMADGGERVKPVERTEK